MEELYEKRREKAAKQLEVAEEVGSYYCLFNFSLIRDCLP